MDKCSFCNKKLKLISFDCKCGGKFCSNHRYMNSHNCNIINEKKNIYKEKIKKNNPEINPPKLIKI